MNDNSRRGPQWQQLVGAFLAPILGATPMAWADANRVIATQMFEQDAWSARLLAAPDYVTFERTMQIDWLHNMCAYIGVSAPAEDESLHLTRRANAWVTCRVQAAYPGAVAAIRDLHRAGYTLHTASGESSLDLTGYLTAMGVRECFDRLYGPDLIETFKPTSANRQLGPTFYTRLLADAGVAPGEALVVDDNAASLMWAAQAGTQTLLIDPETDPDVHIARIGSLAELPGWLERMS